MVAMDASWGERQNTLHGTVGFIDVASDKSVDSHTITKLIGRSEEPISISSNGPVASTDSAIARI
jgi:hypothetical protein